MIYQITPFNFPILTYIIFTIYHTAIILKSKAIERNNIVKALECKAEDKQLYSPILKSKLISQKRVYTYTKVVYKYLKHKDCQTRVKHLKAILRYSYEKWQNRFERFSIFLSKISNNHGQNWGQVVGFTLGSGLLFFGLFYLVFLHTMPITSKEIITLFNISFAEHINDFLPILSNPSITVTKAFNIKLNMFLPEFFKYLIPTDSKLLVKFMDSSQAHWGFKSIGGSLYLLGKALIAYGVFEIIEAFRKFNKIS